MAPSWPCPVCSTTLVRIRNHRSRTPPWARCRNVCSPAPPTWWSRRWHLTTDYPHHRPPVAQSSRFRLPRRFSSQCSCTQKVDRRTWVRWVVGTVRSPMRRKIKKSVTDNRWGMASRCTMGACQMVVCQMLVCRRMACWGAVILRASKSLTRDRVSSHSDLWKTTKNLNRLSRTRLICSL